MVRNLQNSGQRLLIRLAIAVLAAGLAGQPASAQFVPAAPGRSVDDLTVVGMVREVDIPRVGRPTPNYSIEQTASFVCEAMRSAPRLVPAAREAHQATVRARNIRIDAASR